MESKGGPPRVLIVDGTQNLEGWEHHASGRIFRSMRRRRVQVTGPGPLMPSSPGELEPLLAAHGKFNCLLLSGQGRGPGVREQATLKAYWSFLSQRDIRRSLRLLALWTCGRPDPQLIEEVLATKEVAPIVLASDSHLEAHEAFVFFSRFFEELTLHSPEAITPPMARFAYLKTRHFAKEKVAIHL